MSFTNRQNSDFAEAVVEGAAIDRAVEWIGKNLKPEDVFSERALEIWATQNGFKQDEDE